MTATVEKQAPGAPAPQPSPAAAKPQPVKDVRYLALRNFALSLSVFNIFGYTLLGFEQPWLWPLIAMATAYVTEIVFEVISGWANRRAPRFMGNGVRGMYEFLLPAHITALAVNMLLYANNQIWPVMFGVIVGVAGKYILQAPVAGRMRHYMNPSNLGIAVTLLCFGSWISIAPPYEFTENANTFFRVMIPIVLTTAGTVINAMLTRKVPLIVGWMGGFAIQAFVRHWIWHVSLFSALGVMTGVAFVLFTNYMITDPGTTPFKARPQFVFGASLAVIYAVLMLFNVVYTLFFATAILCAIRGLGWWAVHLMKRSRAARSTASATLVTERKDMGVVAA
ncbi:enediyne biosynthesis protein [Nocardia terpenica]|uniref:Enediyne biosynthesis protein n=1 Tax=Nocardia terpenica TaxID=455432 RepID=A0A164MD17_9NOCA|nr:enediyne biosynthesis protein [Nocardia terpenica]KZM73250.1 enediyne biosynthesis protein [Nocardia terpenica]MBF6064141.1 enediyne biosynthesis protein [Nocardia terpenica]MBF6106474.1 enediyne biosynthesis protein [Nocardia terpenica]MBF6113759.1 enediyne biosynthesis protein [Nocardia terpenica]MBF6120617.1 enediyne biosynthesis protein [Nocardia terpenica]